MLFGQLGFRLVDCLHRLLGQALLPKNVNLAVLESIVAPKLWDLLTPPPAAAARLGLLLEVQSRRCISNAGCSLFFLFFSFFFESFPPTSQNLQKTVALTSAE